MDNGAEFQSSLPGGKECTMRAVIIEHANVSDLPETWCAKLPKPAAAHVKVRIAAEAASSTEAAPVADFVTNDPAFGIWRDREDNRIHALHRPPADHTAVPADRRRARALRGRVGFPAHRRFLAARQQTLVIQGRNLPFELARRPVLADGLVHIPLSCDRRFDLHKEPVVAPAQFATDHVAN